MKTWLRWVILGVVVIAVLFVIMLKSGNEDTAQIASPSLQGAPTDSSGDTVPFSTETEIAGAIPSPAHEPAPLPRMLELGSVGCRPCDMMTPILEELRKEYAGELSVEFYDVRKDPWPARLYSIRVIPTQIFIDSEGKEIYRHEGYLPKEEILPVLASMGVSN